MRVYTVYLLRTSDEKVYIGTTSIDLKIRWNNGNGYRFIPQLWNHIKADGWDSVEKEVLVSGLSRGEASFVEQGFIEYFKSFDPAYGYNREMGGIGECKQWSDMSRQKMRKSVSGANNHNFGVHFSEEHRRRISDSNRGQKRPPNVCENIGKSKEKPVSQYSLSGMLLVTWDSGRKAAEATGTHPAHISKVCKGERKTTGGFLWKYAN